MDRMLYIAASGASQLMERQAINANNLANVATTGFQADLAAAQARPVYGPVFPSRVYASNEAPAVDHDKGSIRATGRELDVAINGQGWLAVQAPDGSEAYTRTGDLRLSPEGVLETSAGHPVMGDGGPLVVPPSEKLEIAEDGTLSVRPIGQAASELAVIGRIKLVAPDPATLVKGADGLLRTRDGLPAAADASVRLVSGALESSNVNAVEALMNMMSLARQFEAQTKLMEAARDNDAASARLMNISG